MPINDYTNRIIKERRIARLDNPQAVENAGFGARAAGQVVGEVSNQIQQVVNQRDTRLETIERARLQSAANQEIQEELVKFKNERDLIDPNSAKEFNAWVRQKVNEYSIQHNGSADSRALLETNLIGLQDRYTTQMNQTAFETQSGFIMNEVSAKGNILAKQASDNPEKLEEILATGISDIFTNYGDALDDLNELEVGDMIASNVTESALRSLIDSGQYEEADKILGNVNIAEVLDPAVQRSVQSQISMARTQKNKSLVEFENRKETLARVEQAAGVRVSSESRLRYLSDSSSVEMSYEDEIREYEQAMGLEGNKLPLEAKAAIAFPEVHKNAMAAKGDPNKEFGPDNKLTVSGIAKRIEKPLTQMQEIQAKYTAFDTAVREFRRTGNKAAVLMAIVSSRQTFEPNSAVMEGEVRMQGEADTLTGKIESALKVGQAISTEQIEELYELTTKFYNKYRKLKKTDIDGYLSESDKKEFGRTDIGLTESTYYNLFGTYDLGQTKSISDYSDEELLQMYNGGNVLDDQS